MLDELRKSPGIMRLPERESMEQRTAAKVKEVTFYFLNQLRVILLALLRTKR